MDNNQPKNLKWRASPQRQAESSSVSQRLSLSFGERRSVLYENIHEAFVHQALTHPALDAVIHADRTISYGCLNKLSDNLAAHLCAHGISRGDRVCLLGQRSIELVISIIAVLKSGAAYIPLDGGIVTDVALRSIVEDARPSITLCMDGFRHRLRDLSIPAIGLPPFNGENWFGFTCAKTVSKESIEETCPQDEAYVIYTSGMSLFRLHPKPVLDLIVLCRHYW